MRPAPWWLYPLTVLVRRDYYLRSIGRRKDRWHWADRMLWSLGYVVTDYWKGIPYGD